MQVEEGVRSQARATASRSLEGKKQILPGASRGNQPWDTLILGQCHRVLLHTSGAVHNKLLFSTSMSLWETNTPVYLLTWG